MGDLIAHYVPVRWYPDKALVGDIGETECDSRVRFEFCSLSSAVFKSVQMRKLDE